jgi:histidinol-phosphate/aromatic aminotransferase/cobyric acid decarboxylase-like protein
MPGIRLGYLYSCNNQLNDFVRSTIPIWNLNSAAEFFLEIILKHRNALKQSFTSTIKDRIEFSTQLSKLPVVQKVFDSGGNFLLVRLKTDAVGAAKITDYFLSQYSIYLKDVSKKFSDNAGYLRFAVRLPEENATVVKHLREKC